ncbi:hypothetical protein EWM64_g6731 [Hericium alpestre]|uniref:GED domain-containing protein n=1 Tax=Hericium alpestre TaxID=135208 RepID=A0A4Y9ZTC5_9AGAM|nr:hypothetical protein EWM64_g6731 [Hericium alpestre]
MGDSDTQSLNSSFADGMSSSKTSSAGIGLSDPAQAARRRRMLDAVNRLRSTGAQLDVDLPVIAVIGSQSAGKSSLIESISGVSLPRASGTCTRCPTECQLSHVDGPWQCQVTLRLLTDVRGADLGQPQNIPFGGTITSKGEVTARIRRAQRAILNPSTDHQEFLLGPDVDPPERESSFSKNCICLAIEGRDVADLSFVDLPGIIQSVGVGGQPEDVQLIRELAISYITKPSCIILETVACETDLENQAAHGLASQYDPNHTRTIGVLTKPDRIGPGDENNWLPTVKGMRDDGIRWFCVKNPDTQALLAGISWEGARAAEMDFFENHAPWSDLEFIHRQSLGTAQLTEHLSNKLADLIARRLPDIQEELEKLLQQTEAALNRLPPPPSDEPVSEMFSLIGAFTRAVEQHTIAPEFLPWERHVSKGSSAYAASPQFLTSEESCIPPGNTELYIDEVMRRANTAVTRELPGNFPFIVIKQFILEVVQKWHAPSNSLFDSTKTILLEHMQNVVDEHFQKFGHGGLKQRVSSIVATHIRARADQAAERLAFLLKLEAEPYTRNHHYFQDYRSKFFKHYKDLRKRGPQEVLGKLSGAYPGREHNYGLPVRPASPPPDVMDPALGIMADVRAYFQVAYKRFVDNVPMTLDQALVLDISKGLDKVIFQGLGVNGEDFAESCRRFLAEPESIRTQRQQLVRKKERLLSARTEIEDAFR